MPRPFCVRALACGSCQQHPVGIWVCISSGEPQLCSDRIPWNQDDLVLSFCVHCLLGQTGDGHKAVVRTAVILSTVVVRVTQKLTLQEVGVALA